MVTVAERIKEWEAWAADLADKRATAKPPMRSAAAPHTEPAAASAAAMSTNMEEDSPLHVNRIAEAFDQLNKTSVQPAKRPMASDSDMESILRRLDWRAKCVVKPALSHEGNRSGFAATLWVKWSGQERRYQCTWEASKSLAREAAAAECSRDPDIMRQIDQLGPTATRRRVEEFIEKKRQAATATAAEEGDAEEWIAWFLDVDLGESAKEASEAATASAADDGNAEESNAWFLDVADVSGMLHEAATLPLAAEEGNAEDLGESPKEASEAATLPLAADDGNAEESIAWLSDVADVSGMLHEASYRLWERSGMHWPQDLGESPKEASEAVSTRVGGLQSRFAGNDLHAGVAGKPICGDIRMAVELEEEFWAEVHKNRQVWQEDCTPNKACI
ncbi:unnamed protein product [Symbiodinium microadriaticum]|nr:unnamed protein product [Symbiodinium microadriaticum]